MALRDIVAKLTGTATKAISDLRSVDTDLRGQLDDLQRQRVEVLQAMPPRTELMAAFRDLVAGEGRSWRGVLVGHLIESVRSGEPTSLPRELLPLAAFMPDLLVESVRQHLADADLVDGPPMAARAGLLGDLAARERELEAEHARLVDAAAASGIVLQHLPGEVQRRATERLQRQSAEAFNAMNADGIRRGAVSPRVVP